MGRFVRLCLVALVVLASGAIGGRAAAAPAATLVRWPYVQNMTATSAVITWATDTGSTAEVRFSTDQSYSQIVAATTQVINSQAYHAATLTGLQPATTYYYRVRVDGADLTPWAAVSFSTATAGDSFTFVAFGDSRGSSDPASPDAIRVSQQMAGLSFDLALHVGDLTLNGSYGQLDDQYFGVYRDLIASRPFYPTLGNHDYYSGNPPDPYLDAFYLPANGPVGLVERAYAFDWGNAHFVALDTNQPYAAYAAGSPQYAWLEADLAATTKFWKFVFFHNPPYSSAGHGSDTAVRTALGPLFERYGVDLIFTGHNHFYERTRPMIAGSVAPAGRLAPIYLVVGGGGAPLHDVGVSDFTALSAKKFHFTRSVVTDCVLTLEAIDDAGALFDTLTLNKCGNRARKLAPGMDYDAWFTTNTGFAVDPTYFGAYALTPLADTLYLGFGAGRPADVDGSLLASSDGTAVTAIGALSEQGFIGMTAGGGKLFVPGPDPCCTDGWTLGNVYSLFPPGALTKHRTNTNLVNVLHMWSAWYDATEASLYAATGVCHEGITNPDDATCQSSYFGKIYRSTDDAVTWSEVARGDTPVPDSVGLYRTYDIIGFNNRLYATWNDVYGAACGLIEGNRSENRWSRLASMYPITCRTRLVAFGSKLLALKLDQSGILALGADGAVTTHDFPGFKVRDWSYNYLATDGAGYLYTVTDDGRIVRTTDLSNWQTVVSTDLPLITVGHWPARNWLVAADRGSSANTWRVDLSATGALMLPQAPGLTIARTTTGVKLDWPDVTLDVAGQATTVRGYRVYRSSTPYFNAQAANRVAAPVSSEFPDTIGGPADNRYYQVRTEEPTGNLSLNSGRVGVFVFALQAGD